MQDGRNNGFGWGEGPVFPKTFLEKILRSWFSRSGYRKGGWKQLTSSLHTSSGQNILIHWNLKLGKKNVTPKEYTLRFSIHFLSETRGHGRLFRSCGVFLTVALLGKTRMYISTAFHKECHVCHAQKSLWSSNLL